jgi:hypothetical protein
MTQSGPPSSTAAWRHTRIVRDRACQLSHLARSDSAATMRECSHMIVPVQLAAAAVLLMPHALGTARGKA